MTKAEHVYEALTFRPVMAYCATCDYIQTHIYVVAASDKAGVWRCCICTGERFILDEVAESRGSV
jgi:hypothetical protein